jgi:hypothetical protein
VPDNFITGRNNIIAKQIFWEVIKSHDIMARYKDKSFKNDPSILSEYVKFLIMNTEMDIVNQLVKRVSLLGEKVLSMIKELKAAEAKASLASNGVNTVQKAIDAIAKRVTSLESKK